MNVKEMSLGGWSTSLMVLVAMCSLGNEPFDAVPFICVMLVLAGFCCLVRGMMLYSASKKQGIDWMAFRDFAIGAGISVIVPAVLFSLAV